MPLEIPKIDDRDYQQILNEALVRIPVHNPEWTNYNDSDPGITLVQLFAFMTENLLYRSNLIPERNRIKFLKLLGVPVEPAAAAKGIVTFSNLKGPLQTETLPRDLEVKAGQVPFRTKDGIDALPIEAKVYYKKTVSTEQISQESTNLLLQLYAGFQDENKKTETKFYETRQLEAPASGVDFSIVDLGNPDDTIDGSLWVSLLARKKDQLEQTREDIANKVLTLGVLPALTGAEGQVLPAGPISTEDQPEFTFHMPIGETFPSQQVQRTPRYRLLEAKPSGNLLSEPGVVHLTLPGKDDLKLWENLEPMESGTGDFPPSLEETDIQERVITWVRIRVSGLNQKQSTSESSSTQLKARLSWVGINAARVEQLAHVTSENLGLGTGEPDQTKMLTNTPVISKSVNLTVNGETWQRVEDLMTADSEISVRNPRWLPTAPSPSSDPGKSKVFTVDRESGEIRFGDGLHGTRPSINAIIRASYDYGGGTQGNLGIGSINKSPGLTNGIKVTNEIPTWGGDEAESVVDAEKHISAFLRHRDRLVSADDFKIISQRTPGIELGRVEVLSLFHPDPNLQQILSEGVVTLMVIPKTDSLHPDTPEPDRLFLDTICDYLNPRRLVTTELHVCGPEYIPIWVSVGIDVVPGKDIPTVREAVKTAIQKFLSSLEGGFEGIGWPLDKAVEKYELWAKATQVEGVSKVNNVLLAKDKGAEEELVEMNGLQLPRILGLSIQSGEPKTLEQLRADSGSPEPGEGADIQPEEIFPVPVVPSECK
jgi:hypothetical protein